MAPSAFNSIDRTGRVYVEQRVELTFDYYHKLTASPLCLIQVQVDS